MVMFFGLCNSPATFQSMMNHLFKDLIDQDVVVVYMDNILIFTENLEEHRQITENVLRILKENDLYLKPEKCEFEQEKIEYLGLIISKDRVEMDPVKVQGILDWPVPKKLKDVQAFIGFCNFYQRFIKDFSNIAKPLTSLTKKDTDFEWTLERQNAFDNLKQQFTSAPMLVLPDPSKPMKLETDASDFAWGAVLTQLEEDNKWHPVAYVSKSLTDAERNYDIHDKELKAIIGSLEAWRHYLEGTQHQIKIWTDHRNLEYFQKNQKLSRRQARWSQFLQRFDYKLIHKSGVSNRADGLSRRIDHKEGVEHDNKDCIVLPSDKFFEPRYAVGRGNTNEDTIATRHVRMRTSKIVQSIGDQHIKEAIIQGTEPDDEVSKALETIKKNGPRTLAKGLEEWNYEDELILFRGKIYVPKDNTIRREVVKACHDPIIMGHPGRYKTLEMVQQNFWWPGMSLFVKSYVDGCATCQETKNITHPTRIPLQPTEIPDRPFQFITIDFIVKLPLSNGFDSILMIHDQSTKTMITEPCNETITAEETADLLIKKVFSQYGIAEKIISDRGPQFASKVMKAILWSMGSRSALTTAYHPQADGATERMNQEAEQFLRAYCNRMQNNWSQLLPYAEMTHNTREHTATKKTPFELLLGMKPWWPGTFITELGVPTAEEQIWQVQKAREEAAAAAKIAQEAMKTQYNRYGDEGPDWKINDLVWLEGKNLKTQYPTAKLAPKRFGPFPITRIIGKTSYKLKLPDKWKIHNVFHGSLLTPYRETEAHGPNYERPQPTIIDDKEEYEVEQIIDCKQQGRNREWVYLIKWKGYPDSENSWEPLHGIQNALETIKEWHARNPRKPKPKDITIKLLEMKPEAVRLLQNLINLERRRRRSNLQ